jgi:hypothetical protein
MTIRSVAGALRLGALDVADGELWEFFVLLSSTASGESRIIRSCEIADGAVRYQTPSSQPTP